MTNLALFTKEINDRDLIHKFLINVAIKYPECTLRTTFYWDDLNDILNETQN